MKPPSDLVDPLVTLGVIASLGAPRIGQFLVITLAVPRPGDRLRSLSPSVIAPYLPEASAVHPFCCLAASVLTPSLLVNWFLPFLKFPKRENLIPKFLQSTYHQAFSSTSPKHAQIIIGAHPQSHPSIHSFIHPFCPYTYIKLLLVCSVGFRSHWASSDQFQYKTKNIFSAERVKIKIYSQFQSYLLKRVFNYINLLAQASSKSM